MRGLLKLMKNEFRKLKRKMFIQLVLAASFLFPIPLTAIISSICKVKEKICGMTIGAMEEQSRFLKIALTDLNDYKITRKNGNINQRY